MTAKEHILNVLRDVLRSGPSEGEDVKAYLDKKAEIILAYMPEEKKNKKPFLKDPE